RARRRAWEAGLAPFLSRNREAVGRRFAWRAAAQALRCGRHASIGTSAMRPAALRRLAFAAAVLIATALPAAAQQAGEPVPSKCLAMAESLPTVTYASFLPAQTFVDGEVTITYAGHSTYVIETPGGVR